MGLIALVVVGKMVWIWFSSIVEVPFAVNIFWKTNRFQILVKGKVITTLLTFNLLGHGGILATLMDEIAYFAFVQSNKSVVALTKSLSCEYKSPIRPNQWVLLRASLKNGQNSKIEMFQNGKLCVIGEVLYTVPPTQVIEKVFGMTKTQMENFKV